MHIAYRIMQAAAVNVTGQLVKVRKLSSRLAFADLVLSSDGETIELVIKEGQDIPSVKDVLRQWQLGDVVSVRGQFEEKGEDWREHRTFLCGSLPTVLERGSEPFRPVFTLCRPCGDQLAGSASADGVAAAKTKKKQLCKYFTNEKVCPRGASCAYVHTEDGEARRAWFAERKRRAIETERLVVGGPATAHDGAQQVSKARRAHVFASFLVERFALAEESLVLDVAGGRGDLCFELSALRGVPCVSVDPRGRKLSKRQRVFLKKQSDRDGDEQWGSHIRNLFDADFFAGSREDLKGRVSIIVGLHPDEATEHIVDCALKEQMPFAIVPCCVFPIAGGSMSFKDWCDYLQAKDGRIRRDYLDCQGKNLVLYCTF